MITEPFFLIGREVELLNRSTDITLFLIFLSFFFFDQTLFYYYYYYYCFGRRHSLILLNLLDITHFSEVF